MFKYIVSSIVIFIFSSSTCLAGQHHFVSENERSAYYSWIGFGSVEHVLPEREISHKLLAQYAKWEGAPYLYGGHRRTGIDCSAFTKKLYKIVFYRQLPRTTAGQVKSGVRIIEGELRPGDLVFFKINPSERHVGIYVGGGSFIHASVSHGVMVSTLHNAYWHQHYLTARRVYSYRS